MAEQYKRITVTPKTRRWDGVTPPPTTMIEVQFCQDRHGVRWKNWEHCCICGHSRSYTRDQLKKIHGKFYCIPRKHYLDAPGRGGIKDEE